MAQKEKKISDNIFSSDFYKQTSDSLKDEDNVSWVMELDEPERKDWIDILQWIRAPDRLLERDRFETHNSNYGFQSFLEDWKKLRTYGTINKDSPFATLFENLKYRWNVEGLTNDDMKSWDQYLESLKTYLHPETKIRSMEDYERALYGLSGTFFQALPHAPKDVKNAVGSLGILDQFYNNLRDLEEDTKRGICYFPVELLEKFGIDRTEISKIIYTGEERFSNMMEYLLSSFVTDIKKKTTPLFSRETDHYSWKLMLDNVLARHSRIEYVSRVSSYNMKIFNQIYWNLVKSDLERGGK